jgi:acyl-CoA dehydrogenase
MTDTSLVDPDVVAVIRAVISAAASGDAGSAELWTQLAELGLTRLTAPEAEGGSGAGWRESAVLVGELAAYGMALPAGEHDLLAGWLLRTARLASDDRQRTVAILEDGTGTRVPFASASDLVVCLWPDGSGWRVSDVPAASLIITPGTNIAGEPRDTITVPAKLLGSGAVVGADVPAQLELRGGLLRAIQIAGALEAAVALAVDHVQTRKQFGRPLAAFQAVQHLLADMAAEAALARAAVDAAVDSAAGTDSPNAFRVAVARSCAGHAASVVVRHAHQLLGAIGTTREHPLHRLTLPVLAWRAEYGPTEHWDQQVAAAAAAAGPGGLWSIITAAP